MRKYLQKALSILLILCFGTSALLYLFFDIAQLQDKNQAQQEIKSQERLEIIKLSLTEFRQLNGADELWHNGALYDISGYSVQEGFVLVTVFHDCNEESLVQTLAESFEPNGRFAADNIIHITRHHIHPPTDGKILNSHNFSCTGRSTSHKAITVVYFSPFYPLQLFSILKPPPDTGVFI